ncbi:MAG: class I SAM-dependent methyltransferase [Alphaproteobacteria bacterium]|nr:class I SAM-dependent methyltransferase [Alphaproteobacteria bacterium]
MTECIVCRETKVEEFLDLGHTALANKFLTKAELQAADEPLRPLRVGYCHGCGHVQLTEHAPPPEMFDDYLYVSSFSQTLTNHLQSVAATMAERQGLGGDDLAVDIGSNDGTLLTGYAPYGNRVLGVDPAKNLMAMAAEKGIETYNAYFGAQTAQEILEKYGPARAITATNSFPHIPDLHDFMTGVRALLAPDGLFLIEAHYCVDMFAQGAFDTIYHEHVSYWALAPMMRLMESHGLQVIRVERLPLHHGQLRVFIRHAGQSTPDETVAACLDGERNLGVPGWEACVNFAAQARKLKTDFHAALQDFTKDGKRVAGYGAPAKANTLLGFLGVGPDRIPYIADLSPLKQGRYTPGTHIPVVAPSHVIEDMPDYLIIFAWNFAEEVMTQMKEYADKGGRFVLPVPEVRIL